MLGTGAPALVARANGRKRVPGERAVEVAGAAVDEGAGLRVAHEVLCRSGCACAERVRTFCAARSCRWVTVVAGAKVPGAPMPRPLQWLHYVTHGLRSRAVARCTCSVTTHGAC